METGSALKLDETSIIEAEWVVQDMEIDEGEFVDTGDGEFQVDKLNFAGQDWTEDDNAVDLDLLKENAQQLLEEFALLRDQVSKSFFSIFF